MRGKWICYFSLLRLFPSSFQSASVPSDLVSCACLHVALLPYAVSDQSHVCIKAHVYLRLTSASRRVQAQNQNVQPRPPGRLCRRIWQSSPVLPQAGLLLLHPSWYCTPLPWLTGLGYTTNHHIASTRMCLCGACEAWNSNIDFSIIFSMYVWKNDGFHRTRANTPSPPPPPHPHLPTQKSESCSFLVITPVLLLILD